jgi:hypothetical protein
VSLIFEALKKLDREKDAPDRGVVVVGAGAWGEREPRSRARVSAALGLVLLGLGVAAFALRSRQAPARPEPAQAVAPQASPEAPTVPIEAPLVTQPSSEGAGAVAPPPPPRLVVPTAAPPRAAAAALETVEPTPPPDPVVPHEPQFRLNAISARDGRPVALLNDRLVREGDMIEGVRVLHIGEDYVEIEVKGERRTIRF